MQKFKKENAVEEVLLYHNPFTTDDSEDSDDDFDESFNELFNQFEEEQKETFKSDENVPSYQLINVSKLEEGEEPLSRVIGHENQKKELLNVIKWFKNSKALKERGVSIPKGVILFGAPGNGKSLLIKEMIRCCEAPVFLFQGDKSNVAEGIVKTFEAARNAEHSIIVFDELDLLLSKDKRAIRVLQENLDGVESTDDILVIAATNFLHEIPKALLRNGRLEKLIRIPDPTGEEAVELLKMHFKEFNIELPADFDDEEVALSLNGICCAGVKAVVNDLVLRNGFENLTNEMLFDSIYNITDRVKDAPEEDNLEVAIHEAGHAVVAKAYSKYYIVNRLNISGASGSFEAKEVEKDFWPYEKAIADIKISMAGVIAQKVLCGRGGRGCEEDLQRARRGAYHLFNLSGYSSCWETLPEMGPYTRVETPIKRRKMERKIEALLRKCERETTKYIKSHKNVIKELGNLLYQKKHLKSSEILSVIG